MFEYAKKGYKISGEPIAKTAVLWYTVINHTPGGVYD